MAEVLALGWGVWAFCAAVVFVGGIVQRLAGQGFGMVSAPMLALVAPDFLPATLLLLGLVIGLASASIEVSVIARDELPAGMVGRALGAFIGVWIALHVVDRGGLQPVIAAMVYLGIALSLLGVRVAIRPLSLALSGIVGGIMGTLTAVGAPPMALLYQHEESRRSAAMQNVFFAWGMIVSILSLALVGLIGIRHVVLAASLMPVVFLALIAAQPLARRVARSSIRPYALGLAGLAATTLLIRYFM